jgi:RimJ/RimL family protein N-acetyltransferase
MDRIIETPRLFFRLWSEADREPFFQINQDPLVIEHLRGALSMEEVDGFMERMNAQWTLRGHTCWAVCLKATDDLIGFIGLNYTPWMDAVEIGWRLGSQYWGQGYATEGARAALKYGLEDLSIPQIISFTVPANTRSIAVMEKIGLQRDLEGDFAHPLLPGDHRLSRHVLYRSAKK